MAKPKQVARKLLPGEPQFKTARCVDFKVADPEQGIVEAIVSVFDNEDFGGDIVRRGAFADSLKRKMPKVVWMHDWEQPIGKTLAAEELAPGDPRLPASIAQNGGLWVRGQLNLEKQLPRDVLSDLKGGFIDEFSFGYMVDEAKWMDDGWARELTKVEIFEWSPVLMGMNPATALLSAKDRQAAAQRKAPYQPEPYQQGDGETVVCPQCEKHNAPDAMYCDQCGYRLAGSDDVSVEPGGDDGKARPVAAKGAVPVHHSEVQEGAWDGPEQEKNLPTPMSVATVKKAYGWYDSGAVEDGELAKSDCKFIHHFVGSDGKPGAASKTACSSAIAVLNGGRGGANIPDADREGVWKHMAAHLKDAGVEDADIPPLKSRSKGLPLAEHAQAVLDTASTLRDGVSELTTRAKSIHGLRKKEGRALSAARAAMLGDIHAEVEDAIRALQDAADDLMGLIQEATGGSSDEGGADGDEGGMDDMGKDALALRTLKARTELAGLALATTGKE